MSVNEASATGKNSCTRYIPDTYIIMKETENEAEIHMPTRLNAAYALGADVPMIYFVSYNAENFIDIIDNISNILAGLFIVMNQFI